MLKIPNCLSGKNLRVSNGPVESPRPTRVRVRSTSANTVGPADEDEKTSRSRQVSVSMTILTKIPDCAQFHSDIVVGVGSDLSAECRAAHEKNCTANDALALTSTWMVITCGKCVAGRSPHRQDTMRTSSILFVAVIEVVCTTAAAAQTIPEMARMRPPIRSFAFSRSMWRLCQLMNSPVARRL